MGVQRNYFDDDTFNESDQIIIEMASRGASHSEMAEATQLSNRQISRKLAEPKFRTAIRKFCRDLFELRMRHIQTNWDKMENCFVSILDDEKADTYAKIAAATQIKGMCFQARELDVEDELDNLREKIRTIESTIAHAQHAPGTVHLLGFSEDDS